ncbi:MAG TPA: S-methyl-5-thioribose-1-phosphate isomerase, partial [Candidatus Omnitrophota bacterium]|nr:S-methyl-5-thioribose-1-phosphate isomerase [Candidatus Omnitrophota bacterium]
MLQTIAWTEDAVRLLDQTRLPAETVYVDIANEKQMWDAIQRLVVRGAPAIGVAAAFGVYLGVRGHKGREIFGFYGRLNEVCDYLATSRPTAVNLFWAIDRMRRTARDAGRATHSANPDYAVDVVKQRLLAECLRMLDEDTAVCRAIGMHGAELLAAVRSTGFSLHPEEQAKACTTNSLNILTHCNAGGLATVCYGTALAPIYVGTERGMRFHVWSDETRPLLQGSRITAFELQANGIPVTVICDNMAATVMKQGRVDAVIVGTDRVAANGDVANKIGTYLKALAAHDNGVPFWVALPHSTLDMRVRD